MGEGLSSSVKYNSDDTFSKQADLFVKVGSSKEIFAKVLKDPSP